MRSIFYTTCHLNGSPYSLGATSDGIVFIENTPIDDVTKRHWFDKFFDTNQLYQDDNHPLLVRCRQQLQQYFDGKLTTFDIPLDLKGTSFQKAVWNSLLAVQYGQSKSYKAIAESIGKPTASQAVGAAVGQNPIMIIVPCHRILGATRKLTGFRGGLSMKEQLLQLEHIPYKE